MVILMFITSFFEFDWYHHEKGIDFAALLSLFGYLALGVLIHYYVLYGIKKQVFGRKFSSLYFLDFLLPAPFHSGLFDLIHIGNRRLPYLIVCALYLEKRRVNFFIGYISLY